MKTVWQRWGERRLWREGGKKERKAEVAAAHTSKKLERQQEWERRGIKSETSTLMLPLLHKSFKPQWNVRLFFRIILNVSSLLIIQSLHTIFSLTLYQPREACTIHPLEVNNTDHLPVPVFGFQSGPLVCLFTHICTHTACKLLLISANKGLMDSFYTGAGAAR